jgi:DNA-binding NtrC family response regulator
MPIRPFDLQNKPAEVPPELENILENAGLRPPKEEIPKTTNENLTKAREALNKYGANLDAVAQTISHVMTDGETDSGKLKAAELAYKVHGIIQEMEDKPSPQITININGSDSKNLLNLLVPTP